MLDELAYQLERVQGKIALHGELLQKNELLTRMSLIDPVLQLLGWDTTNPAAVIPEYRANGFCDYGLLDGTGNPVVLLEAKPLGTDLAQHRDQMLRYALSKTPTYAGLTNGNDWEVYRVFEQTTMEERLVMQCKLTSATGTEALVQLLPLWKRHLIGEVITKQPPKEQSNMATPLHKHGWVTLSEYQLADYEYWNAGSSKSNHAVPRIVKINDREFHIRWYRDLIPTIARYLWEEGILKHTQLPINRTEQSNNRLLAMEPASNWDPNNTARLAPGLYYDNPYRAAGDIIASLNWLLQSCGVAPENVWLYTAPRT